MTTKKTKPTLVLCSSSPYRKLLLKRLRLPFKVAIPNINEAPQLNESPAELVKRLAVAKAKANGNIKKFPNSLIIGCDQIIVIDNEIIGKPNNYENAVKQLTRIGGRRVTSYTGLCLLNTANKKSQVAIEPCAVVIRDLTLEMITNYLRLERPYNCAGSIKADGLGVVLFEWMEGRDPTALIGLPLIQLIKMLESEGVRIV